MEDQKKVTKTPGGIVLETIKKGTNKTNTYYEVIASGGIVGFYNTEQAAKTAVDNYVANLAKPKKKFK